MSTEAGGGAAQGDWQPGSELGRAVLADARTSAAFTGVRFRPRSASAAVVGVLALVWRTDAAVALVAHRLREACRRHRIPVLPGLLHRVAVATAQVCIDDRARVHPGVRIPHGQVVVAGHTEVHRGVALRPWVTLGPRPGEERGPTIERRVSIGTGAHVIGDVRVGVGARVGAGAVVLDDVPAGATVVGAPARVHLSTG